MLRLLALGSVAALAVTVATALAPVARGAGEDNAEDAPRSPSQTGDEETLIPIGPNAARADDEADPAGRVMPPGLRGSAQGGVEAVAHFWIGVSGDPLPAEVRAQVEVPPGQGVLVRQVVPGGPAEKGGVEQFDIVVSADGNPVRSLSDIAEEVGARGEKNEPLSLGLLRRGKPIEVTVTPEQRALGEVAGGWAPDPRVLGDRGALGWGGLGPFGAAFGGGFAVEPGGVAAGQWRRAVFADGLAITMSGVGEGPAEVDVRRGAEHWAFRSDDADAIAALPDDVRRAVEGAMERRGGDPDADPISLLQRQAQQEMQQQMLQMRQELEQFRNRFEAEMQAQRGAADPAPRQDPPQPSPQGGASEIELPSE